MRASEQPQESSYILDHPGYRELSTDGLRLITPDVRYAPDSLRWLSDPEVGRYMGADFSDLSLAGEDKRLRDIIANTDAYDWMIEWEGRVIGNLSLNSIAEQSGKYGCRAASMAILIGDKSYWGKGIARSANMLVIDWAFRDAGFDEIHARIREENAASAKSFVSLGFEPAETEREQVNGTDVVWNHFVLSRRSWKEQGVD
jgi:RimJ/RimL family protein N-acetyltransferase